MRESRIAQANIFKKYSDHQHGIMLQKLSQRLDEHPQMLDLGAAGSSSVRFHNLPCIYSLKPPAHYARLQSLEVRRSPKKWLFLDRH